MQIIRGGKKKKSEFVGEGSTYIKPTSSSVGPTGECGDSQSHELPVSMCNVSLNCLVKSTYSSEPLAYYNIHITIPKCKWCDCGLKLALAGL